MKMSSVKVKGFRALVDVEVEIDDFTALIGANGAGKSTLLHAVRWFLEGGSLTERDLSLVAGMPGGPGIAANSVHVTATFTALDEDDRAALGVFGRGRDAVLTRSWSPDRGMTCSGIARTVPEFLPILDGDLTGPAMRERYKELIGKYTGLTRLVGNFSRDAAIESLHKWENSHQDLLQDCSGVDATCALGVNGALGKRYKIIFIPAAAELAVELSQGRNSTVSQVVEHVASAAAASATQAWEVKHADVLSELSETVSQAVDEALDGKTQAVNAALQDYLPSARVAFSNGTAQMTPQIRPTVTAQVATHGGPSLDVTMHGHGVQRAVMMSLIQALGSEGQSPTDASQPGPVLMLAIEEPEAYQHPVQARALAKSLRRIASGESGSGRQVIVATHSPAMLSPESYSSIRRFTYSVSGARISGAGSVREKNKYDFLPTIFAEAFFAHAVVLVEGVTDKAILDALEFDGKTLDVLGIAVVSVGGKKSLAPAFDILSAVNIPAYVVFDGDGGDLDPGTKMLKEPGKKSSHRVATESLLERIGELGGEYVYGAQTYCGERFTAWHDDIEGELEKCPEFLRVLDGCGIVLRSSDSKQVAGYSKALRNMTTTDLPHSLRRLWDRIITLPDATHGGAWHTLDVIDPQPLNPTGKIELAAMSKTIPSQAG